MKKNVLIGVIAFLGLYLFSTGISFAVFTYVVDPPKFEFLSPGNVEKQSGEQSQEESKFKLLLDISGPKTEVCPLNGKKYTVEERKAWENRRPLLVMVENHEESRPQSGLSSADIVYETVAEGGITRFMGVFYCGAQSHEVIIGPIRSARSFFLDWASEYGNNPLYTHVGGANCNHGCPGGTSKADALGQIERYGWGGATGNDLNQFSIGYPTFWRDYERLGRTVATEHTMYSTSERLWGVAKTRGWTNMDEEGIEWNEDFISWKFAEEESESGSVTDITYDFWSNSPAGDYSVKWTFDSATKLYSRFNPSNQPHKDLNVDEQLTAKNIIVMYSVESPANDGYPGNIHLLYGLIGKGDGVLFQNGKAEEITWSKATRTARTKYFDSKGREVLFEPGTIWISNLPKGNKTLTY